MCHWAFLAGSALGPVFIFVQLYPQHVTMLLSTLCYNTGTARERSTPMAGLRLFRQSILFACAAVMLAVPLCALQINAQRGSNSSSNSRPVHTISLTIRVSYENDRFAPAMLRVSVNGTTSQYRQDAFTDDMGIARFDNVPPGAFRVKVSGQNIEDMSSETSFEIQPTESNHNEYVHVKYKLDAENAAPGGPPISVAELNIPDKARSEFLKGMSALDRHQNDKAKAEFEKALGMYP